MSKVLLVAWREFKHTALTKAFIIGAVATPLFLLAILLIIPLVMKPNLPPLTGALAVLSDSGSVADHIQAELEPHRIAARNSEFVAEVAQRPWDSPPTDANQLAAAAAGLPDIKLDVRAVGDDADLDALKDQVRRRELVGLIVLNPISINPAPDEAGNRFELFVPPGTSPNHTRVIEDAVAEAVISARVEKAGADLDEVRALVARPRAETLRLAPGGGEVAESPLAKSIIPMVFMMLLWIATFTSGNYLLTTTIEEKSNKVIEVLLSAVSPMQLMAGKILGQAAVSVIMLAMYAGLGLVAMAALAMLDLIPPIHLLYLALYFIMAYFMVAAIMAGVGSAVNELREAQSLIGPAMIILAIPWILWYPISENPNGLIATITSFIPPLIPFIMILRVTGANEPVALWQIILSLIIGFGATVGMIWMCAKVFRVGVLMYGKPPSPIELFRWLRQSEPLW